MYFKSLMLLCAFGFAVIIGLASNHNPIVRENIIARQDQGDARQEPESTNLKSHSQPPKQKQPNQQPSKKNDTAMQPQKGARLNSVHLGLSHAGLQTTQACTSCHQANDEHFKQYSPYFLGFFSNIDSPSKNEVDVAFLGVNASDVPSAVRSHLKLNENNGAIVNHVVDESPAYHCGIEQHDVLIAIDNQPIDGEKNLLKLVRARKPGTKIVIEYVRAGKKESCNLVLGKQKTARILNSFRINGCEAQLTSATNCQSCHAIESK